MCDILQLFQNITNNCDNDIDIAKDQCKVICMVSIVKALDLCYFEIMNTGLLDNLKEIIKFCYYKKYEGH
tara:strand:+ start:92 stop:301 length:210 start_codon:yes stop_codon:yes gene_type:complete